MYLSERYTSSIVVFNCFTRYAAVARRTGGRLRENIEDFYLQGAAYPCMSYGILEHGNGEPFYWEFGSCMIRYDTQD